MSLALALKATQLETKYQSMPIFGGNLGKGESGTQRRRGTRDGRTPQGITGNWVQAEGGKGGSALSQETEVDSGTQHGLQV